MTLTLGELVDVAGVSARTIRYYQAERLLQPPGRDREDGRVARYGVEHVERLRLIGELRDRGLKLPAIRDLIEKGDQTTRIADWLGLDSSLRSAWASDGPRVLTSAELEALTSGLPAGTRGMFEDEGLVARRGGAWLVPNPALLDVAVTMVRDGVRVEDVVAAGTILRRHLGKAARELVERFVTALSAGFGEGEHVSVLVDALRSAAWSGSSVIFNEALEAEIGRLLDDPKRLDAALSRGDDDVDDVDDSADSR